MEGIEVLESRNLVRFTMTDDSVIDVQLKKNGNGDYTIIEIRGENKIACMPSASNCIAITQV